MDTPTTATSRTATWFAALQRRTALTVAVAVGLTALLTIPFLTMAPDQSASTEPTGDVFTARDRVDDTFASSVRGLIFIAEHDSGDVLRAEPLTELLAAQERLRQDPEVGPTLFEYFEVEVEREVDGVISLADLVDEELRSVGIDGVAAATDDEVKDAGAAVIERYGERSTVVGLSAQASRDDDGDWVVPAVAFNVLADDTVLGFGNISVNLGGDTEPEEYDRSVQEVLRTAEGFQVNGVAIDVNLTSQEQGAVAGPFIGMTILAVLLLVGLTLRSYWALAVVGASFLALIVWLKGITNLIGLEDDLVLALIVPVAMISFGVDYAFHAIGRYREERESGRTAGPAFVSGMSGVSGALILALLTGVAAFLANVTSGIESIVQFGIGTAIALLAAYLLLGVVTPLVMSHIEANVPPPTPGRRATARRIAAGLGAASMAMGSVLLMVFVLPWLGAILAAATIVATLAVPYVVQRRRTTDRTVGTEPRSSQDDGRLAAGVGRVVAGIARRPVMVVGAAIAVSAAASTLAVQVPAEFDVEDFFSSDTDFVVGLDQLDTHVGDRGGEPALVYIEADVTDPTSLAAIQDAAERIRDLDTPSLARDGDGRIDIEGGVFSVLDATWSSPLMAGLVAEQTGVSLSDVDGDGIPDDRAQIEALLTVAAETGVPFDAERLILTPDDVNTAVEVGEPVGATLLELQLVDSRAQESVAAAFDELEPITDELSAQLGGTFVQVTGSPFVREASLDATNRALQVSLPVAVVLCLLVAGAFLRSVRYGLASVVPILMVVTWLYALMEVLGYSINLVTATIAAVSIGIGIDFAIHYITRYREELERHGQRSIAVRIAGEGTGLALVASAVSSSIGFGLLAFAPMPLFAAYGLLTAIMIIMALVATLVVLPSLLVLITRDQPTVDGLDVTDDAGRELVTA
ncbi:MAG: efflux RND transporter permease subunit [Actinomycetota bacterium]